MGLARTDSCKGRMLRVWFWTAGWNEGRQTELNQLNILLYDTIQEEALRLEGSSTPEDVV